MSLNIQAVRQQFPQMGVQVHQQPLVYFDSAATVLKPTCVIEAIQELYAHETANIHRGAHFLGNAGTERYEKVRKQVAQFLNARDESEIVFTRGTTESLNLVSTSYARH